MAILLLGEQPRLFHLVAICCARGVVIASRQSSAAA